MAECDHNILPLDEMCVCSVHDFVICRFMDDDYYFIYYFGHILFEILSNDIFSIE